MLKKIIAIIAFCAMLISLSACANVSYVAVINGNKINSGVYLYYMISGISEARELVEDSEADIFTQEIDEIPASDWISDYTQDKLLQHVAIENRFDELGLVFDEYKIREIENTLKKEWEESSLMYDYYTIPPMREYYESVGVGRASYYNVRYNEYKKDMLFEYYYSESGVEFPSEEETHAYFLENYGRVLAISMVLTDGAGEDYDEEGKQEIKKMAEDYLARAKAGEDMDLLLNEYTEWHDALVEAANPSETTAETFETITETLETITETLETTTDTAFQTTSDLITETEAADTQTTNEATETTDVTVDETATEDENAEDNPYELPSKESETMIVKPTTPTTEGILEYIFTLENNEFGLYLGEQYYYVVQRLDVSERTDWEFDELYNILHAMKDSELDEKLMTLAADFTIEKNEASYKKYLPEKIKT